MWDVYLYIALFVLVLMWWFPPIRSKENPIVFFDGVCNLCNGFVDFLVGVDRRRILRMASLQGATAKNKIQDSTIVKEMNSIVFLVDGKIYQKSGAFLKIMRSLGGWWAFFMIFWIIPRPIRDYVYDLVASNRYRVFGKRSSCRIPTEQEKRYFLD